jgi:hypothetical protein
VQCTMTMSQRQTLEHSNVVLVRASIEEKGENSGAMYDDHVTASVITKKCEQQSICIKSKQHLNFVLVRASIEENVQGEEIFAK